MRNDEFRIVVEEDKLSDTAKNLVAMVEAEEDPDWDHYDGVDVAEAITHVTRNGDLVFLNLLHTDIYDWHEEFDLVERSCWDEDGYIIAIIIKMKGIFLVEYWIEDLGCLYTTRTTYEKAMAEVKYRMKSWRKRDRKQAKEYAASQDHN